VSALLQLLLLPLMLLNFFGALVAGIWLAVLGDWRAIGYGIASIFVSTFILGIALLPQSVLGAPAIWCYEKGYRVVGWIFGLLSAVYLYALITVWCGFVFWFFMSMSKSPHALFPLLLWSYGIATAPWSYMANKETQGGQDGSHSGFTVFFIQIGYLVMGSLIFFAGFTLGGGLEAFIIVMAAALILHMALLGVAVKGLQEVE
jgi:hypothetical protein